MQKMPAGMAFLLDYVAGAPPQSVESFHSGMMGAREQRVCVMKNLWSKAVSGFVYVIVTVAALVFLPAWTLHYWQAWTFLAVFTVSITAIFIYLAMNDPELLARRVKTREKEQSQKVVRFLVNLSFTAAIVISALDHRFAWSATPLYLVLAGDGLVALGMIVIFFVFRENTYTGQTVEVEAGQKVISTGPYALVRHPLYVGGIVYMAGIPLALGSLWGMLTIVIFAPAMAWRILGEEKLLTRDLPGYAVYCQRVRYRLIPWIW
jgi:protein-S-isoprenylcysteine O-methyltransferase Ste14